MLWSGLRPAASTASRASRSLPLCAYAAAAPPAPGVDIPLYCGVLSLNPILARMSLSLKDSEGSRKYPDLVFPVGRAGLLGPLGLAIINSLGSIHEPVKTWIIVFNDRTSRPLGPGRGGNRPKCCRLIQRSRNPGLFTGT